MKFPAKILLFGEYGLLMGGSGFAIPYTYYGGSLQITENEGITSESVKSHNSLKLFLDFVLKNGRKYNFLDLDGIKTDIEKGLWFNSNIPKGYGLGSSGALVAALYNKYSLKRNVNLDELKSQLAIMESYFHGSSSGADPTVSYNQVPLLIHNVESFNLVENWNLKLLGIHVFLVDTQTTSKTLSLVDWFKSRMLKVDFKQATENDFLLINQKIIKSIGKSVPVDLDDLLTLSRYQLDYLSPMVPDEFRKYFFNGIENRQFAFKLCGSGGGGFMLCFTTNREFTIRYLKQNGLSCQEVE